MLGEEGIGDTSGYTCGACSVLSILQASLFSSRSTSMSMYWEMIIYQFQLILSTHPDFSRFSALLISSSISQNMMKRRYERSLGPGVRLEIGQGGASSASVFELMRLSIPCSRRCPGIWTCTGRDSREHGLALQILIRVDQSRSE
jgi:hypothetical protein